jgi:hypothetical protein
MPYSRQRQRIAPNGRISVRLTPEQRDLFIRSSAIPKNLGHLLHHAPVREGKLSVRIDRVGLEAMILAAARVTAADRAEERALAALLRYLESREDRFADPDRGDDERPAPTQPE